MLQGNQADEAGVTGNVANTTDGSTPITASTDIDDIYGYNQNAGDSISISGTDHNGNAVTATNFAISSTTTVGNLLTQIQNLFGNVTASVTSSGQIQVIDNATGTSNLSLNLDASLTGTDPGTLSFGSFGQAGTISQSVLQQGQDASFSIDGMNMTSFDQHGDDRRPGCYDESARSGPEYDPYGKRRARCPGNRGRDQQHGQCL